MLATLPQSRLSLEPMRQALFRRDERRQLATSADEAGAQADSASRLRKWQSPRPDLCRGDQKGEGIAVRRSGCLQRRARSSQPGLQLQSASPAL